jgi:hypothetical protein
MLAWDIPQPFSQVTPDHNLVTQSYKSRGMLSALLNANGFEAG